MSSFQSIVRPVITICSGPIYTARVQASIGSMFPVETAANAKNAPVILLDEATASLDVDNETMIQESLSQLIKNKTVMIIAHRMRTVADADKIVVLKDGKVAESGKPSELMAKSGIYAGMVNTQLTAANWSL